MFVLLEEIRVKEKEQAPEGVLAAPVGGCCEKEQMVRFAGNRLDRLVTAALLQPGAIFIGREFVGLIHHHQVPRGGLNGLQAAFVAGQEVYGYDKGALVITGKLPRFSVKGGTVDQTGRQTEFLLHLLLPLFGQATGSDDQDLLDDAAKKQLLDQQAGHDSLAGAGIVGQQKTDAGQRKEVTVYGLNLVRQRVNDTGVDGKEGIELVGNANALGLGAKKKKGSVTVEGVISAPDPGELRQLVGELRQLVVSQRTFDQATGLHADPFDEKSITERSNSAYLYQVIRFQAGDHIADSKVDCCCVRHRSSLRRCRS